jgi:hypothetical protein
MNRFVQILVSGMMVTASFAAQASAQSVAVLGKMLYDAEGKRVAAIYRIADDGTVQVIVSGKLIEVPKATLSLVDDKLVTSMVKKALVAQR